MISNHWEDNWTLRMENTVLEIKVTTKGIRSQTQAKDTSEAGTENNTETKAKDAETTEVTKTKSNTSEKTDTNANNNDIATGPDTSRTEESRDPNPIATDTAQREPHRCPSNPSGPQCSAKTQGRM